MIRSKFFVTGHITWFHNEAAVIIAMNFLFLNFLHSLVSILFVFHSVQGREYDHDHLQCNGVLKGVNILKCNSIS